MTNDNVISLPSASAPTIPEPPPMTPPPGLLVPGPGGEDDTNTGSREEMPWDGEQGPAEDELVTPPVSDPKNPTPAEVLATLLALCTALGVAGLRRLWLAYSARKGSAGGRDRGGSGGRGGGSGWSRRTTGRTTTGLRMPGASPTGRGGSKTSGAATGRDRGGRDRSPSRSRDHDRSHRGGGRDHDRSHRSRDRDRSGRRYRAGERPVASIVRREIDAARRRADNKRGDGADGAPNRPATPDPAADDRDQPDRDQPGGGQPGEERTTPPPPPPPPPFGGTDWMRPPPGATRIHADAEVIRTQGDTTQPPPPPAAAYRHKPQLLPGPDDNLTPAPAARGASMTTALAPATPPRHDDAEITVHDVVEAGRDAAQEITDGAAYASSLEEAAVRLGAQLDALRGEAAELEVPGNLVADLAGLSERAGLVQSLARELAAALTRAAEAVRAAADAADQRHRPLADAAADHGHSRPAAADYHTD